MFVTYHQYLGTSPERRNTEVLKLNEKYRRLVAKGGNMDAIYATLVKQEYYALLSQYTYTLHPKSLRSERVAGSAAKTDASSEKGIIFMFV